MLPLSLRRRSVHVTICFSKETEAVIINRQQTLVDNNRKAKHQGKTPGVKGLRVDKAFVARLFQASVHQFAQPSQELFFEYNN